MSNFKKFPSELVSAIKSAVRAAKAFKAQEKEVAPRAPREKRAKPTREVRAWRRKARAVLRQAVGLTIGGEVGNVLGAVRRWDVCLIEALDALETLRASGADTEKAKAAAFATTRAAQDRQYERAFELAAPAVKAARQKYDQRLKAAKAAAIEAGVPGPRLWEVKAFQTKAAQLETEREAEIEAAYSTAADASVMEAEEVAKAAWDAYGGAVRILRDDVSAKFNAVSEAETAAQFAVWNLSDGFNTLFGAIRTEKRRDSGGFAFRFKKACEKLDEQEPTPRLIVGKTGGARNMQELESQSAPSTRNVQVLDGLRAASRRAAKLASTYAIETARIQKAEVDLESILAAI